MLFACRCGEGGMICGVCGDGVGVGVVAGGDDVVGIGGIGTLGSCAGGCDGNITLLTNGGVGNCGVGVGNTTL